MSLNSGSIGVVCFALLSGCLAGSLVGCVSDSKKATEVKPTSVELPVAADYSVPESADFNVDLTLVNEVIDSRLMALQDRPQVTFTIWGYDELAADVAATSIKVSEFELRPQAVPYYLRVTESEMQAIEFQSGSSDTLKYYITMGVDVDGDKQICNGDLRQDYAQAPPERFPVTEKEVVRDIIVSEISGEICSG